jgi:hypothetical protein
MSALDELIDNARNIWFLPQEEVNDSTIELAQLRDQNQRFLEWHLEQGRMLTELRTALAERDEIIEEARKVIEPLAKMGERSAKAWLSDHPILESEEHCHADRDGDCSWVGCPQIRDGEPAKTGRHCPLDHRSEEI